MNRKLALIVMLIIGIILVTGCVQQAGGKKNNPTVNKVAEIDSKIKLLNSTQKESLSNTFSKSKPINQRISSSINSLITLSNKKSDPKLTDLTNKIKNVYSGNTITVLLDETENNIDEQNENLDEGNIELQQEINAEIALTNQLNEYANQTGDNQVLGVANSLNQEFRELRKTHQEFTNELNDDLNENINDVHEDLVNNVQHQLEEKYGTQENDLDEMDKENIESEEFAGQGIQENGTVEQNGDDNSNSENATIEQNSKDDNLNENGVEKSVSGNKDKNE